MKQGRGTKSVSSTNTNRESPNSQSWIQIITDKPLPDPKFKKSREKSFGTFDTNIAI